MPRIVDHDRRREKLLEKTFRLFVKRGYAGVTMREVADAADVSIGSLYHYFDDKDDLFQQMLGFLVAREIGQGLEQVLAAPEGEARVAALWRFVGERERSLAELLHVALDHQRSALAARRKTVAVEVEKFRLAIRDGLAIPDDAATELIRRILGRLVHLQLLGGMAVTETLENTADPVDDARAELPAR